MSTNLKIITVVFLSFEENCPAVKQYPTKKDMDFHDSMSFCLTRLAKFKVLKRKITAPNYQGKGTISLNKLTLAVKEILVYS